MYIKYNDFELLYLIEEGSELAYQAMIDKYSYLIQQKLKDFNIKNKYREDYFQEGLICIEEAIRKFDEYRGLSFTNFVTSIITHRFQKLLSKEKDYFYNVTLVEFPEEIREEQETFQYSILDDFPTLSLSECENDILKKYLKGYKPREIANIDNIEPRKVYNSIARIKQKMKKINNESKQNHP